MAIIEKIAYYLSEKNRKIKFEQFLSEIKPLPNETILDVGVNNEEYSRSDNFLEKHYTFPEKITAVSKEGTDQFSKNFPEIKSVVADGKKLPFGDDFFDISYSNAVVEHVGNRNEQIEFLKEMLRVSGRGYFTTPNRYFPVEIHTRVPFLHLILSKKYFDKFLRLIGKNWATENYMNLLTKKDLVNIIKIAGIEKYKIHTNQIFGFSATFSVIWKK